MIGRRRGGMSLGRVAKKAAVATVVNRVVSNALDNRMGQQTNMNRQMHQQPMQQPMNAGQAVMTNICPSCQSGNPQHAKFCLNCGNGFPVTTPQQATPTPTTCPGCKASLAGINGNFCPYCRTAIG